MNCLLDVSRFDSEAFIADDKIKDLEIKQRERQLNVEARLMVCPALQIVDAGNFFDEPEILVAEVDCMLKGSLVLLILSDEPLDNITRLQLSRLHYHVW